MPVLARFDRRSVGSVAVVMCDGLAHGGAARLTGSSSRSAQVGGALWRFRVSRAAFGWLYAWSELVDGVVESLGSTHGCAFLPGLIKAFRVEAGTCIAQRVFGLGLFGG